MRGSSSICALAGAGAGRHQGRQRQLVIGTFSSAQLSYFYNEAKCSVVVEVVLKGCRMYSTIVFRLDGNLRRNGRGVGDRFDAAA
jgi:hypothetical protein